MAMTFLEAARKVLLEAGGALHYKELTDRALKNGLLASTGSTPAATMYAQISVAMKKRGVECEFVRVSPGVIGLRSVVGSVDSGKEGGQPYVPFFPIYQEMRALMPSWVGARPTDITGMRAAIFELTGTPQEQVDWSAPDSWIPERLNGSAREWATRTWEGSGKRVNPRHATGHWLLATNYALLEEGPDGCLRISARGRQFLEDLDGSVVQEIDEEQGLRKLLGLVADLGGASRSDLVEPWKEFLFEETNTRTEATAKSHLYYRLRNLEARSLVARSGKVATITSQGLEYLARSGGSGGGEEEVGHKIRKLLNEQQRGVRESIRELLFEMDPYAFEGLIKLLLEEIGYQNVEVTSAANDRGVDVVADIELGITSVREVVQVKRHRNNVQRPTLDALRGVLHRFRAVRGTIITTGAFSKGTAQAAFEQGAAPITLIDGEKLVELLIEHNIGVKKKAIEMWELDALAFAGPAGNGEEGSDSVV